MVLPEHSLPLKLVASGAQTAYGFISAMEYLSYVTFHLVNGTLCQWDNRDFKGEENGTAQKCKQNVLKKRAEGKRGEPVECDWGTCRFVLGF